MNIDCWIMKGKIVRMFQNFTPEKVVETRAEVNSHLLVCKECRTYFYAKWDEAQKRFAERKSRMSEG